MQNSEKLFLRDCAKYIKGEIKEIKISGPKSTLRLFAKALSESRKLYKALNVSGDMSKALPILESKRTATRQLRDKTGFVWPF